MNVEGKKIVLCAKKDNELYYFNIYDYPMQKHKCWEKFEELISDNSLKVYVTKNTA